MLPPYILDYIRQDHCPQMFWQPRLAAFFIESASPESNLKPSVQRATPQESQSITVKPDELVIALKAKGLIHSHRRSHRHQPGTCRCGCGGRANRRRRFVAGHNQWNGYAFRGLE